MDRAEFELVCTTIGVPVELSCAALMDGPEHEAIIRQWGGAMALPLRCVDALAVIMRRTHTEDVYDTQATVRRGGTGERPEVLENQRLGKWIPRPGHREMLKTIAKRFHASEADVTSMDITMRMKRARGTTLVDGRVLFYAVDTSARMGEPISAWFDITLSESPTQHRVFETKRVVDERAHVSDGLITELQAGRMPQVCAMCAKFDTQATRHKTCSVCHKVRYCNRDCQTQHWKTHKPECQ